MSETVTSQFQVKDVLRNEFCLKDLEKGITVFVQRERHRYDSDLWKDIAQISTGDTVKLSLESQNWMHTVWEITAVEILY